jgi:Matrixin
MSLRSKLRKCRCLTPPIERPVAPLTKLDLPGDTGPLTMPTVATTTGVTTETSVGTTDFPTAPVEDELLPVCYVPKTVPKPVEGGSPERERAVILIGTLWVNYTVIRYHLATSTTVPGVRVSDMQDAVRRAFKTWKDIGMGLEFVETKYMAEAEIRVSFEQGGSWSYVGTDNINGNVVRFPSPTMNFGWNISTT